MYHQIFVIRWLCEKFLARGKVCFETMDLQKMHGRADRRALWQVVHTGMCRVGGRLLRVMQSMYEDNRMCVRTGGEKRERFKFKVKQDCVMSSLSFNMYKDGAIREIYARTEGNGMNLVGVDGQGWELYKILAAETGGIW